MAAEEIAKLGMALFAGWVINPIGHYIKKRIDNKFNLDGFSKDIEVKAYDFCNHSWTEIFYDEERRTKVTCVMDIAKDGTAISGTMSKVYENGLAPENFKVIGKRNSHFFYGSLESTSMNVINFGVFLLQVAGKGDRLEGGDCWYDGTNIKTSEDDTLVVWHNSNSKAEQYFRKICPNKPF